MRTELAEAREKCWFIMIYHHILLLPVNDLPQTFIFELS